MGSILIARHNFSVWWEKNNPIDYLKSHGVKGDGVLDHLYHCISVNVDTEQVFYRKTNEPDNQNNIVDVIVMNDGETFENSGILDLDLNECLDYIELNYEKFKDRPLMHEIPIHKVPMFNPDSIEFDFPQGTTGKMSRRF